MPSPALPSALLLLFIVLLPSWTYAQRTDWPSYNGNHESTRFSALAQITPDNASRLGRVCAFDTGEQMSQQSDPIVIDGVLFVTTDTSTYAIDARTCALKWRNHRAYSPLSALKNNHGLAFPGRPSLPRGG